jgi:hypothetical protein
MIKLRNVGCAYEITQKEHMFDETLENARLSFETLARIAKAMLDDASRVAMVGTEAEVQELEWWIHHESPGAWDFATTIHIVRLDEVRERMKIQRIIDARREVERSM